MENSNLFWTPPEGETLTSVQNLGGKLIIFTDKGAYSVKFPKLKWYQKVWRVLNRKPLSEVRTMAAPYARSVAGLNWGDE